MAAPTLPLLGFAVFPVDSPNGGCPIGKIENHLTNKPRNLAFINNVSRSIMKIIEHS